MPGKSEHFPSVNEIQNNVAAKLLEAKTRWAEMQEYAQVGPDQLVMNAFRQRLAEAHQAMRPAREYTDAHGPLMRISTAVTIQHGLDSLENIAILGAGII